MGLDFWTAHKTAKACLLESSELAGFFSKGLVVPAKTRAYVVWTDGRRKVLESGQKADGEFQAILTRNHPFGLPNTLNNVATKEGYAAAAAFTLEVEFGDQELEFEALRRLLLHHANRITSKEIEDHFSQTADEAVRRWVSVRPVSDIWRLGPDGLRAALEKAMQETCFEAGVVFKDVTQWEFTCETFERIRAKDAEAQVFVEQTMREQQAKERAAELKKDHLLKALQYEMEIDGKEMERRLVQFDELRVKLGGDENRAMIALLEDEDAKKQLIKSLIERDMTPEQLRARSIEDVEKRLHEKYQSLLQAIASKAAIDTDVLVNSERMKTRRVLVALGKQVLCFDPTTNLDPDVPKERHDLSKQSLGYIRSIRAYQRDGQDEFYAGAQRGVYRIVGNKIDEFPFSEAPRGKGGINSVAIFRDRIYASHSEMGIYVWDVRGLSQPRAVLQNATSGKDSVRGVFVDAMGNLYFSAGSQVFRRNLIKDDDLTVYNGAKSSLTSFLVVDQDLVAGDKTGRILVWKLADPNSPRQFRVVKSNPIYMLKSTMLRGLPHLLIGSKDYGVTASVLEGDVDIEFRGNEPIRWVGGASDMIYGVDRTGYRVLCWDGKKPAAPALTIRVADSVQDLYVIKERAT